MKKMKKILATLVAVVMVMALAVPAFAADQGSIKITNATKGQTYTAYKIFDATANATANGDAVAYTTNEAGKKVIEGSENAPFTVSNTADSSGRYAVQMKETATEAEVVAWISANYAAFGDQGTIGSFNTSGSTYTISGLDYGYYYVKSSLGAVISIDTVTGTVKEIKDKNTQGPNTPDKKIIGKDGQSITSTDSNDAKVGSTESFQVSYNATNWVTKGSGENVTTTQVKNFYIKDTPTGLDIDVDTVKVTVNGEMLVNTEDNIAYTATKGDNGTLEITIPWVDDNNNSLYGPATGANGTVTANIPVVVTYDATITTDAATQVATNEVHIYYNHDSSSTTDEVEVTTPDDPQKTTTYTYKFQLNKTDENNNALAGAQFKLYDGETEIDFVANGDTYRLATDDDATTTATIDMTEKTTVYITGLDNKSYTLKETKAPDGYNLAANTTIYPSDWEENGNKLVKADGTYGANAGDAGNVTVVNKAGATLPTTGGIGTTIFYALGAILVIGAGVALIVRRRMNSER